MSSDNGLAPLGRNFSDIEIHSRKYICKYRLQNGGHFVQEEMS